MADLSDIDTTWKPGGPPWCHARRFEKDVAICGEPPHVRDLWSDQRSRITCVKCLEEIERRLAARDGRGR